MLADQECRCHDNDCGARHHCSRWVYRNSGSSRTPHSWSLYPIPDPEWAPNPTPVDKRKPCPYFVSAGSDVDGRSDSAFQQA